MKWAFIIGASSGFGLATARKLGSKGYNLLLLHRDRRVKLPEIVRVLSLNLNAYDQATFDTVREKIQQEILPEGKINVFVHSLADGNIGKISVEDPSKEKQLTDEGFRRTIEAMGISFITWSRYLKEQNFFAENARIIGITSEGTKLVLPLYAAVAVAKSVLETSVKYLAVEFASFKITTNLICAGVSDTNALKVFPDYQKLLETYKKRNPFGRLTTPEDVANAIYLLSMDEAAWINGATIRVDGGEQIAGVI